MEDIGGLKDNKDDLFNIKLAVLCIQLQQRMSPYLLKKDQPNHKLESQQFPHRMVLFHVLFRVLVKSDNGLDCYRNRHVGDYLDL